MSNLSAKPIPTRERLIFALDVPTVEEGKRIVEQLGDAVIFYKLGLQIFMAGGYYEFMEWLAARGKKVFADLKVVRAAASTKGIVKILAVTVLTSLDEGDLRDLGFQCNVEELVLSRARRAIAAGADGVISSGLEAEKLRGGLGESFLIVSPGIRPVANQLVKDDQKRIVDVEEAFQKGADYIVVGRPIRNAADPRAAAERHQSRIARVFGG
jgi:orotidine-5'-phosphate decarboxylase